MQLDKNLLCADKLAFTNGANANGDYDGSGNPSVSSSIDMKVLGTDAFGGSVPGDPGKSLLQIFCQVVTAFVGASATVEAELISADDAALTSNVTSLRASAAIGVATLVAGYRFAIGGKLPEGITQRYVGFRFTVGTADVTAGAITAGVVFDLETA